MHRFFAQDAAEREILSLDENESRHARSVLRVREGEAAELLDGQGRRFAAQIGSVENGRVLVRRLAELPGNEPGICVTLYPGLPKADAPEKFVSWTPNFWHSDRATAFDAYGLYNVNGEQGFLGLPD